MLFKATNELNSLSHLSKTERAPDGENGNTSDRDGRCAEHRY